MKMTPEQIENRNKRWHKHQTTHLFEFPTDQLKYKIDDAMHNLYKDEFSAAIAEHIALTLDDKLDYKNLDDALTELKNEGTELIDESLNTFPYFYDEFIRNTLTQALEPHWSSIIDYLKNSTKVIA